MLCRVFEYCSPGLPKPTTSQTRENYSFFSAASPSAGAAAASPSAGAAATGVSSTTALRIERWATVSLDRKSTRLNSSHSQQSRMPSSA